jgi:hypothetical protein
MAYTSSQVVQAVPTGINSALVFIDSYRCYWVSSKYH